MNNFAIETENLGKRYEINEFAPKYGMLRDHIAQFLRPKNKKKFEHDIWALRGISFSVKRGEILGIIGKNGAGKSTLMKILSRITLPTQGRAILRGRVRPLAGAVGFHMELTGIENIYLNAGILGMRKLEVDKKLDSIVEFSETGDFLYTPLKFFSSGMRSRLAFAVAFHLDLEILLIDETFAFSDISFSKKCFDKMTQMVKNGTTVIFATHDLDCLKNFTQDCLYLKQGRIANYGPAKTVIDSYLEETVKI